MIRVLVVDDSSFMRKSVTHILAADPAIEVIDTAGDGETAIRKVKRLKPDVVLLDVAMPVMDGLTALMHIMAECPMPVLVMSGIKDAKIAIKALEHGAVDFIKKPSGVISYDIDSLKAVILAKVKMAAGISVRKMELHIPAGPGRKEERGAAAIKELVVLGASTGGPRAVANILSGLKADVPAAILVVQHMESEFVPSFVERLQWVCPLDVSVAREGDVLAPGRVLVAPGGVNSTIVRNINTRKIHFDTETPLHTVYPSIDFAMESAALAYGDKVVAALLTGMGSDGAAGMKAVKDAGGATIAEDESTCLVFGMPKAAIELGCVDEVLPLERISEGILKRL